MTTKAYAAPSAQRPLAPHAVTRREPLPTDVEIEILYCGVCHSDLHQARDEGHEFAPTTYPCVPGHEIVGRVTNVGPAVGKFAVGDRAAVGCMVDSCGECTSCRQGLEQYCVHVPVLTYNSPDKHSGGVTYGGYAESIVVDEAFVLKVSDNVDLAATAPLLCAGITTYSPLRHWNAGPGKRVGVVGLGGLGHMAVKLAHAMGAQVTLFTTSPGKIEDGKRLGADEVVVSTEAGAMAAHASSFDLVIDAVAALHDIGAYLSLLKLDGTLCLLGAPEQPLPVAAFHLIMPRRNFAGSAIGSIAETQEMLNFCAERGVGSDVEVTPIQKINEAYDRLAKGDVKYRFVIDMASLKSA